MSPMDDGIAALTSSLLAQVELARGDVDRGRAHMAEARTGIGDASGWVGITVRHQAARFEADTGDLDAAEQLAHEALSMAAPTGADYFSNSGTVHILDTIASISPDAPRAAVLLGAVDARLQDAAHVRDWRAQERYEATLVRLREALGADALQAAMGEGSRLSVGEAVALAQRGRGPRRRPSTGWKSLTPTEVQVVELVAEGLSNPAIAERLFISRKTVTTHLTHVFAKLGVSSRAELAAAAVRREKGATS